MIDCTTNRFTQRQQRNKNLFFYFFPAILCGLLLTGCRTVGGGKNPDSEVQAWNSSQALSVAKTNFRTLIYTCVPKMADFVQAGRGEKVKKFLDATRVDKFLDYILTRSSTQTENIDSILEEYHKAGQPNLENCMGPVAEYVVLEFVTRSGLLAYGFGTKGDISSEPPAR